MLILGANMLWLTIFLAAIIACTTVLFILVFFFVKQGSNTLVWILLVVGLLLGLFVGFFIMKITRAIFMIIGGYLGYLVAIFLYNLFLNRINVDPKVVFWVTLIVCIVLGAILGLYMVKHVLIFGTSIIGGYFTIRGISFWGGNFPSESLIMDLIQNEEWDQLKEILSPAVYAYLAGWAILAVGGIIIQYKINVDKSDDDYKKHGEKEEKDS